MRPRLTLSLLLIMLALVGCSSSAPTPPQLTITASAPFILQGVANVTEVAKLTGPDAINDTEQYGVAGTDLGSMFNMDDKTYFVFGDTFGIRDPDSTGGQGDDWRSNVVAVSTDSSPADGIKFDSFIADDQKHARELIPSTKRDNVEMTKIPTHGIAVGANMYLYYMSVKHWGAAGQWDVNYSGVSKSADGGKTWAFMPDLRWEPDSNFIQVSPFKVKNADGTVDIYFWGIPGGRFGGAKLMKVPEIEIENIASYRYFTGTGADGTLNWSENVKDAAQIVNDAVGELSVVWNPFLSRWIMTYLSGGGDVVMREGINPWGPWNTSITLMTQAQYPGLYGPYMNPKFVENDGETIYFTISRWGPYNVFWMKAKLLKGQ